MDQTVIGFDTFFCLMLLRHLLIVPERSGPSFAAFSRSGPRSISLGSSLPWLR